MQTQGAVSAWLTKSGSTLMLGQHHREWIYIEPTFSWLLGYSVKVTFIVLSITKGNWHTQKIGIIITTLVVTRGFGQCLFYNM